jgi:hypothetical protein
MKKQILTLMLLFLSISSHASDFLRSTDNSSSCIISKLKDVKNSDVANILVRECEKKYEDYRVLQPRYPLGRVGSWQECFKKYGADSYDKVVTKHIRRECVIVNTDMDDLRRRCENIKPIENLHTINKKDKNSPLGYAKMLSNAMAVSEYNTLLDLCKKMGYE